MSNAVIENAYDEMTNMSDQVISGSMVYYKFPKVTYLTPEEYKLRSFETAFCLDQFSAKRILLL